MLTVSNMNMIIICSNKTAMIAGAYNFLEFACTNITIIFSEVSHKCKIVRSALRHSTSCVMKYSLYKAKTSLSFIRCYCHHCIKGNLKLRLLALYGNKGIESLPQTLIF